MKKTIYCLLIGASLLCGCNSTSFNSSEHVETTSIATNEVAPEPETILSAQFDFGGLYINSLFYSIAERTKKKIVLKGNEYSPYTIIITKSQNEGDNISDFTYDFFNSIISGLGSKHFEHREVALDKIEDVALLYNLYDTKDETSIAFIQHKDVLYSIMTKYNFDEIDSDDIEDGSEDTEYGLEEFLDYIEYL